MNLTQAFKMAFKSISSKKTRSFLTMLGIIIGVASVVIMVSVVSGQNKQYMEYYEKMGDNKVNVEAYSYMGQDMDQIINDYVLGMGGSVVGITPNIQVWSSDITVTYDGRTLSNGRSGSSVIYSADGGMVSYSNGERDWDNMPSMVLGNDQYGVCNNYTLGGGRELSYLDMETENNVCVLGGRIKENLFNFTDPVEQTITINGLPYLVVGWYESKDMDWADPDNIILLPYTLNRTLNRNETISSWSVKASSASATTEIITRLDGFLNGMFPTDENGMRNKGYFYVQSDNTWQAQMQEQSNMQTLVMGGIAAISLLVGGIGIMNIMLVTVTERTREIGIRKAIGAERKSIIAQFLIEAAVICGIGGVIGIVIGCLGSLIAGKFLLDGMILWPTRTITVGAFLFSVVLGIFFGMYPAIKASGLQPVVALRAD